MRSIIYINEAVDNKDRRFGSALRYYPVRVWTGRDYYTVLLTGDQIGDGQQRAEANSEDVPPLGLLERARLWWWRCVRR